jgi:hypothetical protein
MSQLPQPSAASIVIRDKRLRRERRRRRFIIAGVIGGVAVATFFALPPIIKAQAVKRLSAELHREVAIKKIRLNPFTLSVTIDGLVIKDRDGGAFTGWNRLYVNFDSFSLFTGEWRFQDIVLDGFSQRVTIAKDGTFNFADLIPPPSEKVPAESGPAKPPRPLRIANLSVTSAAFTFADASRARPFATEVGPLTFTLKNFLTAGDPKAPYEFSAVTESGETLSWRGTVSIDPVRSAGEFAVGTIALKKYAPYYADLINADLLDGSLDVKARYAIDLSEVSPELSLTDAAIKLSRLQVAARGSTTPLIDLPSFSIDGLSADGLKVSATIARIALEGGRVSVVREKDGSLNLLKLIAAAPASSGTAVAASSPAPAASAAAALPDVRLAEFALSGLAIDFVDHTTASPTQNGIERLDVLVKNVSLSEPSVPVLLKLSATVASGGTIGVDGTAAREPLAADLAVKVAALSLAGATPYVEPRLNLRIADGAVSVDGFARLAGNVAEFQGDVVVDKFATVDGVKGEDFVKFTKLAIRGINAKSEPLTANISEILLADPLARVAIHADKTTNLSAILRTGQPPADSAQAPAPTESLPVAETSAPEPVWSLGKFTLTNGEASLSDRSVKPVARLSLDHFSGTVTGLSSADKQRADVDIRGKINGSGAVALTGKLDAKAATRTPGALTELVVDVKGVDLSPISPYVGTYAGYELARSGLAVDVKARLSQRELNTNNVVTLQQFTLGAATNSPEATKLPVRLGIALLKDTDGNIVIDLPVKGDLDDPEFKIGRVVMRVIVNVLAKAATSPFSLIGAAFGGGGDELAYQDFTPGATTPAETELKKIDTLRKALKNRPALNLDITGSYDAEADLAALREQLLVRQVRFRRWEELRRQDPNTPPPAEIAVSPEDEVRIIGAFVAERYPEGVPAVSSDGSIAPPPPLIMPFPPTQTQPQPKSRGPVIRRNQRVFAGAPPSRPAPVKAEPAKPTVLVVREGDAASAAGAAQALTLADARRALASGIPVSDEDLLQLATDRAQRVRDALLAGGEIEADRLFLTPPAAEGKGAKVFLQLR